MARRLHLLGALPACGAAALAAAAPRGAVCTAECGVGVPASVVLRPVSPSHDIVAPSIVTFHHLYVVSPRATAVLNTGCQNYAK